MELVLWLINETTTNLLRFVVGEIACIIPMMAYRERWKTVNVSVRTDDLVKYIRQTVMGIILFRKHISEWISMLTRNRVWNRCVNDSFSLVWKMPITISEYWHHDTENHACWYPGSLRHQEKPGYISIRQTCSCICVHFVKFLDCMFGRLLYFLLTVHSLSIYSLIFK